MGLVSRKTLSACVHTDISAGVLASSRSPDKDEVLWQNIRPPNSVVDLRP